MKRIVTLIGACGLGMAAARSQTLLNSWETSLDGWTVANAADFTNGGFSTTTGVTDGAYSWVVRNKTGHFNWDQVGDDPDLQGPASTGLTALLGRAVSLTLDVYVPTNAPYTGNFVWGLEFSLYLSQPGGVRVVPISMRENGAILGATNTLTFSVAESLRAALLGHSELPCSLRLAMGGGDPGTIFLDRLQVNTDSRSGQSLGSRAVG